MLDNKQGCLTDCKIHQKYSVQVKYLLRISSTEGCLPVTKELFEGTDFGTLICLYTTGAD